MSRVFAVEIDNTGVIEGEALRDDIVMGDKEKIPTGDEVDQANSCRLL